MTGKDTLLGLAFQPELSDRMKELIISVRGDLAKQQAGGHDLC